MNPKHIAIFLYSLDSGGVERNSSILANELVDRGFRVDLVLAKASGPYLKKLSDKIQIIDFQCRRTPEALLKLASYLRREKPHVLLSAMHYTNEVAILAKLLTGGSTKVVVSERNSISEYQKIMASTAKRWMPLTAKLLYPHADSIVAVSQGVADDLSSTTGISKDRIQVIYNPVVTPDLSKKASVPLDHPWFQPGEPPVILGVGRLVEQKDFSTLIKAFSKVTQNIEARLLILGDDSGEKSKLEALAQSLGVAEKVSMPGFVDNPYAYMAKSAVFVLSSRHEGFGNVIAEALAVGAAVVSTNCKSGPAEILDNGKYGALVSVGDVDSLAATIVKAISEPPRSAPLEWLDQFTPAVVTRQYLQVLGLAGNSSRALSSKDSMA